jgi:hypothetical protein
MAISKIRKISSWTLIATTAILVIVVAIFLLGGDNPPLHGKMWYPKQLDLLMYWMYAIFGITLLVLLFFGLASFVNNLKTNPKKAFSGVLVVIGFVALFGITYTLGDATPIEKLGNSDATIEYNTPFWLKTVDMIIFSIYAMFILVLGAVIWGSVKNIFNK